MNFLEKYGIKVKNNDLFIMALTHSSYANEHKNSECYERLEFLGDAILEMITSEYFYLNENLSEGEMSKKRASFVCEKALSFYAKKIGIDKCIRLGHGQNANDTIISDVYEAVLAYIYLDFGFEIAKKYVYETIIPYIRENREFLSDYKTLLQELVQTSKKSVTYNVVKESGLSHQKTFEVEVVIDGITYGKGKGSSKKEAEQNAAYDAYKKSVK